MSAEANAGVEPIEKRKAKAIRDANLSKDGAWRSFPNVNNLIQYVSTGVYYGRVKVNGKVIRLSLKSDVFTTAKLRLADFLNDHLAGRSVNGDAPTFKTAKELFLADLESNPGCKPKTKEYKKFNISHIDKHWPGLDELCLNQIKESDCKQWAKLVAEALSAEAYNHTLGVFRDIFKRGVREFKATGGQEITDPSREVGRLGVKPKKLRLPESDEFARLVEMIETAGGGFSRRSADLVRFLAFSGCRISEARQVTWADVEWKNEELIVNNAKQQSNSNATGLRRVPLNPSLRALLEKLQKDHPNDQPVDFVCKVHECKKSLAKACQKLGIHHLTHHDLRHLFATRCIEAGVDVPTVSRWLGHKDGGALAMRTYGHLRNEHSRQMAQKVTF
jgi:integrase